MASSLWVEQVEEFSWELLGMQLGVGACVMVDVLGRHLRPEILGLDLLHHRLRLHNWLGLKHRWLIVEDRLRLDHHLAWLQVVVGSLEALSLLLLVYFSSQCWCRSDNWSCDAPRLLVQLSDFRLLGSESNPKLSN